MTTSKLLRCAGSHFDIWRHAFHASGAAFSLFAAACVGSACGSSPPWNGPSDAGSDAPPSFGDSGLDDAPTCEAAAASRSYVGCDYWPTVVANSVWPVFDFAVVVANTSSVAADVTVTGPNGLVEHATVPPNELTKIYLPWVKELKGPDFTSNVGVLPMTATVRAPRSAYHLVATRPVVVYQFSALEYAGKGGPPGKDWSSCPGTGTHWGCYSFSNDASLLLPSTAMTGTYRVTGQTGNALLQTPGYFAITATADATTVNVTVGASGKIAAGGGVPQTGPGQSTTLHMDRGDVVELLGEADADLSGSLVKADKPVQVIAGVPCLSNPLNKGACDHVEESVFPAETLGQDYVVTVPTGPNGVAVGHSVRLYGNFDGTSLTYAPAPPPGAPPKLDAGQVVDLGIVASDFRVQGDHAFAVASLMLSSSLADPNTAPPNQKGDPSQSLPVAVKQYRTKYVFLAPDDYDVSYVDIVAEADTTIVLDGASPAEKPTPLGGTGYGVLRVKLGAGNHGAHVLSATKPVGIQVMGYGSYTSYQYPGGSLLASIAPPPPK